MQVQVLFPAPEKLLWNSYVFHRSDFFISEKGENYMEMKLERYFGDLDREQLITARIKALKNATSLYEEAEILNNSNHLARAYFLLCICNEELGKYIMITSAIVELVNESINWKKFWQKLRNHKAKTGSMAHFENIFVSNDSNFTEPAEINNMIPDHEELKMASLYTDMFQNDFFEPEEIINKNIVDSLFKLTSCRINFLKEIFQPSDNLRSITKEDVSRFRREFLKLE